MCGRFSFVSSKEKVRRQMGLLNLSAELVGSYNIAPTQLAYVLSQKDVSTLVQMRWGMTPYWANSLALGDNLFNARVEGIQSKSSFRMPIRRSRCVVVADSFYEWKPYGSYSYEKQPYRILPADGSLLLMAGISDVWVDPQTGVEHESFAILTTEANEYIKGMNNRMPVIFEDMSSVHAWLLKELPLAKVLDMLLPASEGFLKSYPVSNDLDSIHVDDELLHKPVEAK